MARLRRSAERAASHQYHGSLQAYTRDHALAADSRAQIFAIISR